ncbi:MAG: YcaO-like family protein, partial [Pseudomonadota bacterium]
MLTFSSIETWINPNLESDLDLLLQNLSAVGIKEVIWTDLSHEDLQIPVARIVIPGLEAPHDDANYVAGPRARKVIADGR